MDWDLRLTADSADNSETLLEILPSTLVNGGGWILRRSTSAEGVVHICFEFEREGCVEIYTLLMAAGLELSEQSHFQLAQLCHCTKGREPNRSFEPARVDLRILPEQLGIFEKSGERDFQASAYRSRA